MSSTIKALVKSKSEKGIWIENVPMPKITENDVLVSVKKTGICGTDMHIYNWDQWAQQNIRIPLVIGHEFSGEIVDIGKNVSKYKIGQRVSGEGHIVCTTCRNCRAGRGQLCRNTIGIGINVSGSFSEYVSIPQNNIIIIPDNINDETAAIFDPLGNAVHTALSFDLIGEDILITGAGPIGIMAAHVAQKSGARNVVITDINSERIKLAKKMNLKYVIDSSEKSLTEIMNVIGMKEGFDVGLEMSGSDKALNIMIEKMNNGGKIAILGIAPSAFKVDWNKIIFKMLTVKGIYGREMYETWYKMIALIQGGMDLTEIITHKFQAEDFQQGFNIMAQGNCGKVILDWQ